MIIHIFAAFVGAVMSFFGGSIIATGLADRSRTLTAVGALVAVTGWFLFAWGMP